MYKAIIAIGVAAVACLVAGCGSSGEETAEAAVTKAQFIKRANSVCERAKKEREAAITDWEKEAAEATFDRGLKDVVGPSLEKEAEELAALTAPEESQARVTQIIGNLSRGAAAITKKGSQVGPGSGIPQFQSEAISLGLKACAQM